MVNYIGGNVGEEVSAYAASKSVYLQQNSGNLSAGAQALFSANDHLTKIVLDADDACETATGSKFDSMVNKVFNYGTEIDYLLLCHRSFSDSGTAGKLPGVAGKLRGTVEAPAAPAAPTTTQATTYKFRDDFNSTMASRWFWTNGRDNSAYSLSVVPGYLRIAVPSGTTHDCWMGQTSCSRMLRGVSNVDSVFETRIAGPNLSASAQNYGIMVWEHHQRFIRFEFWRHRGDVHVAAWTVNGDTRGNPLFSGPISLGSANSLRVTRSGDTFKLEYDIDGSGWQTVGRFDFGMQVKQAGVHVSNGDTNPHTAAYFDYFSVR